MRNPRRPVGSGRGREGSLPAERTGKVEPPRAATGHPRGENDRLRELDVAEVRYRGRKLRSPDRRPRDPARQRPNLNEIVAVLGRGDAKPPVRPALRLERKPAESIARGRPGFRGRNDANDRTGLRHAAHGEHAAGERASTRQAEDDGSVGQSQFLGASMLTVAGADAMFASLDAGDLELTIRISFPVAEDRLLLVPTPGSDEHEGGRDG